MTYIVVAIDGPGAALCPAIASAIVSAGNKVRVSQSHPKVGFLRLHVHHWRRLLHVDHLRWLLRRVTLAIPLPPVSRSLEAATRMRRILVRAKSQNKILGKKIYCLRTVCFSIELKELQISRCLKHLHGSVKRIRRITVRADGSTTLARKSFLSKGLIPLLVVGETE